MTDYALGGLDIATTTGLSVLKDGVVTTQTFRSHVKKNILADTKALDADREGEIGRKFEDFLRCWLIDNAIGYVAIEAPMPSNNTRKKAVIDTTSAWAGKAVHYQEVAGASQSAIFRIYGLEMVAATTCARLNIPVMFIAQGTWRKTFLGNGRPKDSKKESKLMCQRLGIEISSADAAESVGVVMALDQMLNPPGRRQAEDLFSKALKVHA